MSARTHRRHAEATVPRARVGILTSSDSRTWDTDESGAWLEREFAKHHDVVARDLSPDKVLHLRRAANQMLDEGLDAIIVNGGTGITPTDVSVEAFRPWFEKELPGFGERFRAASEGHVHGAAWLSRATAGIVHRRGANVLLFLLPGSTDAVKVGARLILPELSHAVSLARGTRPHA